MPGTGHDSQQADSTATKLTVRTGPSTERVEQSSRLLQKVDDLLKLCTCGVDMTENIDASLSDALMASLMQMRDAVVERDSIIEKLVSQSSSAAGTPMQQGKPGSFSSRGESGVSKTDFEGRFAAAIFEETNDGVLILKNDACIACNDNATGILEVERSEVLLNWQVAFEKVEHGDGQPAGPAIQKLVTDLTDSPDTLELVLNQPEGRPRWIEVSVNPVSVSLDIQDELPHRLLVIRDITAQKNLADDIVLHRDFLQQVINAVPDQIYVRDLDRKIVMANHAFCQANEIHDHDPVGLVADELISGELSGSLSQDTDLSDGIGDFETVCQHVDKADGKKEIYSIKQNQFTDDNSGNRFVVAAARDVTNDYGEENRLATLVSVFRGSAEGVAILDDEGLICEVNPAFREMVPLPEDQLVGSVFEEMIQLDSDQVGSGSFALVKQGKSWSGKGKFKVNGSRSSCWFTVNRVEEYGGPPRMVALVSDLSELERTQKQLRQQVFSDPLTGLPNRRLFRKNLVDLIKDCGKNNKRFYLCFLDLDDFRNVNDSAGHATGDWLLKSVTSRLQNVLGRKTLLSRFGGDEFAFLLTEDRFQNREPESIFRDLLQDFKKPFPICDSEACVGISLGVTQFPRDGVDADSLMRNADIAMYAAKADGKHQYREFDPVMQATVNLKYQVQSQLRRALSDGEISLMYQPKVSSVDGGSEGCEALVRWKTKFGNLIPPSDFVPIAEQNGVILPLGEAVFQMAAEQAYQWSLLGPVPKIAINVSPRQLKHPKFIEFIKRTLKETQAKAEWFEMEITENAMVGNLDYTTEVIDELSGLGFSVAIDDFGTGYSSLSYLKNFGIHTLKIDISFIRDVATNPQSAAVVQSIISLGVGLGLNVIAEGVETSEQVDFLSRAGCPVFQGYFFSGPMPADDYYRWMVGHSRGISSS